MKASAKWINVNHEGGFRSPGLVLSKLLSKHLRSEQFFNTPKDFVKTMCGRHLLHLSDGWWLSLCFSLLLLSVSSLVLFLFLSCVWMWVCVRVWLVLFNCWLLLNRSSASRSTRWKSHWNLQLRNTAPNERLSISFICFTQPKRWKRCMCAHDSMEKKNTWDKKNKDSKCCFYYLMCCLFMCIYTWTA